MSVSYPVEVPRDVEADLVADLRAFGINAATLVPEKVVAGTTRVSRIGGDPIANDTRDHPLMLIEIWESRSTTAWDRAILCYGAMRAIEQKHVLGGAPISDIDLQTPRAVDDPSQPNFYRVQFTAQFLLGMDEITITEES